MRQQSVLGEGPRRSADGDARSRFHDTFRALRNRNYRMFFSGQTISLSGTWMQTIAQALPRAADHRLEAFASTANTSLQLATPDHLRGRVTAIYMLLFAGSTPIGGFLTGLVAEHLGVSTAIGVNAGICGPGAAAGLLYYLSLRSKIAETTVSRAPA